MMSFLESSNLPSFHDYSIYRVILRLDLEKDEDGNPTEVMRELWAKNPDDALNTAKIDLQRFFGYDYLGLHCKVIGVFKGSEEDEDYDE